MLRRHGQLVVGLMAIFDLLVVTAAWAIAYVIRFVFGSLQYGKPDSHARLEWENQHLYWVVFPLVALVCLAVFAGAKLYQPKRRRRFVFEFFEIVQAHVLLAVCLLAVLFMLYRPWVRYDAATQAEREQYRIARLERSGWTPPSRQVAATRPALHLATAGRNLSFSRTFMFMFLGASLGLMTIGRGLARRSMQALRSRGINTRSVAIFGAGRLGQTLLNKIRGSPWTGLLPKYFVEEDPNLIGREIRGLKVLGPLENTKAILAENPVDEVYVAMGHAQQGRLDDLLNDISDECQTIRMVPDTLSLLTLNCSASDIDGLVVVSLTESPIYGWKRLIKHALDRALAAVGMVILGLPMAIIALLVKWKGGKGPVFYKQTRCSLAGSNFAMLKFRTMVAEAEKDGPGWTVRDDPRVTKLGAFLRKTSLDELPQLINVLRGDMSLVGPRPERPEFIEKFRRSIPKYALRHSVKAGITGWAQVHGHRGDSSIKKRLQYDLHYVENWSLWLDFRILVLTILRGFVNRNAY